MKDLEIEAQEISAQEKSMTQYVATVSKHVKCHLNQLKVSQFTVENAIQSTKSSKDITSHAQKDVDFFSFFSFS